MRIAVLTNDFPPSSTGGAGVIAAEQVRILSADGHDVRVWHKPPEFLRQPGIVRLFFHLLDLAPRREVVREMLAFQPDILVTHNLTGCGFGTAAAVQASGMKWIHTLHDVQLFDPSGQVRDAEPITLWQRFWTMLRLRALGYPDVVVSPTHWLLDQHRRRGFFQRSHIRHLLLPNPAPVPEVVHREEPHKPLRLLFVGRFTPEKGSSHIQYVLRALEERGVSATLQVVGDGCATNGASMVCMGPLAREAILGLMREADVLLVPSHIEENQPTVILEAASVGLPVVASDMGGIPETLGEDGIILTHDDVDAWVDAIVSLQEPERFREAVRVSQRMEERHDPKRYRDALLGLIVKR